MGNITAIKEKATANGNFNAKVSYTYDSLNQLKRENNKDLNKTLEYTYDNSGNITAVKEYAYNTGDLPQTPTKTITYTYDSVWKDKLVNYNGQTITYDSIGNPLTYRNGMSFSWFGRQMESANVNGTAITYKYNADGLRTEKKVGSTVSKYEYTGDKLFYEKRGDLEFHYRYDVFGNVASITRVKADGTSFSLYTVCNSRGDVEELRRSTGELFARYVYDSWGNVLHIYDVNGAEITSTANFAVQNPFRYRGYYYDNETGLYYVGSRYYDPVTHRFVNADTSDVLSVTPMGLTEKNLFAYCDNNPVTRADSSGQVWHIIAGAVVGLASQYVANVCFGLLSGKGLVESLKIQKNDIPGLIGATISGALVATGIPSVGLKLADAAINATSYIAECAITGNEINSVDLITTVGVGLLFDIGAKGINGKGLRETVKVSNQYLANSKSARKISMYSAKKISAINTAVDATTGMFKDNILSTIICNVSQKIRELF